MPDGEGENGASVGAADSERGGGDVHHPQSGTGAVQTPVCAHELL